MKQHDPYDEEPFGAAVMVALKLLLVDASNVEVVVEGASDLVEPGRVASLLVGW